MKGKPKKVWVVMQVNYDGWEIYDVFESKKEAKKERDNLCRLDTSCFITKSRLKEKSTWKK